MTRRTRSTLCLMSVAATALLVGAARAADAPPSKTAPLPVRGVHLSAPEKKDVPVLVAFIGGALAEEGVNTLILEFNYGFDFKSRPEFANAVRSARMRLPRLPRLVARRGSSSFRKSIASGINPGRNRQIGSSRSTRSSMRRLGSTRTTRGSTAAVTARCIRKCTMSSSI